MSIITSVGRDLYKKAEAVVDSFLSESEVEIAKVKSERASSSSGSLPSKYWVMPIAAENAAVLKITLYETHDDKNWCYRSCLRAEVLLGKIPQQQRWQACRFLLKSNYGGRGPISFSLNDDDVVCLVFDIELMEVNAYFLDNHLRDLCKIGVEAAMEFKHEFGVVPLVA